MTRYVVIRLLQGILAIIISTMVITWLTRLTGNPAMLFLHQDASAEEIARVTKELGLDKPLYEQYAIFLGNIVRGNFGNTYYNNNIKVIDLIIGRLPNTIKLGGLSLAIAMAVSVPLGVLCALKREKWPDQVMKIFAMIGQSAPGFWVGIMAILVFAVYLGWLPAGGTGRATSFILPTATMAFFPMAGIIRVTRSSMLEILNGDYVRLARIKGVPERSVIWKHALRNASLPLVTFFGGMITFLVTGSVITETVFAWPGVGQLSYQAVMQRDFPLIQGLTILFVTLFVMANLLIDISYVYLDPRVRFVKL
jgi:peptide/nickel transport system permease protein